MSDDLRHGRNCSAFHTIHGREVNVEGCTCGLKWRIALSTEQTMHAAWRKRGEEAEAELSRLTADNERLGEALRPFAAVHAGQVAEPEKRFKKYRAALLHIRLQPIDFKLAYDALDARAALAKEPTP